MACKTYAQTKTGVDLQEYKFIDACKFLFTKIYFVWRQAKEIYDSAPLISTGMVNHFSRAVNRTKMTILFLKWSYLNV